MYEYRQQRSKRKRKSDYILPFVIIVLLIGIVWAGWSLVSRMWVEGNKSSSDSFAQVMVDEGAVKVMVSEEEGFGSVSGTIKLYSNEKVKVEADGQATVFFSSDAELRLNRKSQVELLEFEEKEGTYDARTNVEKGMVWAKVGDLAATNSTFQLSSDYVNVNTDSAKFVVEYPGTVYMVDGNASVEIIDGGEGGSGDPLKSIKLGVGQQLVVDEDAIEDLKEGKEPKLMFALTDDFKGSNFYRNNAEEDGLALPGGDDEGENGDEEGSEEDSDTTEEDTPAEDEDEDEEEDEEEDKDEPVVKGKVEITAPSNKDEHDIEATTFTIEAKVPTNTAQVKVGNYTLTKYKEGDSIARYYVNKEAANNIIEGKNTYTFTALDENGKEIGQDTIIVNATFPTDEEEDDNESDGNEESSTPGTVSITGPSGNATHTMTTTTFDVTTSVPTNTARVSVNGYTLTKYIPGNQTAVYHIKLGNENVKEGENNYTVIAYDSDEGTIGSDTITVTVNTGGGDSNGGDNTTPDETPDAGNTPSASLGFASPVATGTYSTTDSSMKALPVAGPAPSNAKHLYLNGATIDSFSAGNATWSAVFNLEPGENKIIISGDDDEGNPLPTSTLIVDYQGE